jgi:hypothetical protein
MNTRMILAALVTVATLAACSSPITPVTSEDLGAQPTLEELNTDNDSSLELAGNKGGLGNLLMRKIYDTNQNGKRDQEEPGIPDWGVRIVSVDENGNPDDAADIQVTPQGSGRWRGVNLKVPYGRYKIEELEPTNTKQAGVAWKVTGQTSRIVNVSREKSVRAVEFAGVCLENGVLVKFPKIADFAAWKCHATFDLLPRISSFTAMPAQIQSGGSSTLAWNVLDYSKLEITPTVGVVTGFTGSKNVTPASTTAYTLKATNGFGSRTANVTVNVGPSAGWGTSQVLSAALVPANTPILVNDGRDRSLLVVSTVSPSNPDLIDLLANPYSLNSGWGGFEKIGQVKKLKESQSAFTTAIQARIARNGDAFVWTANDDGSTTVFRKPNTGLWDSGQQLNPGFVGGRGILPVLETDASGNAFLLMAGCLDQIGVNCRSRGSLVARFTSPTGWSNLIALEPNLVGSKMSVQPNGNAVVTGSSAIYNTDGLWIGYAPEIRAVSFTANTGWSNSRVINTIAPSSNGTVTSLTSDAAGTLRMIFTRGVEVCFQQFTDQSIETSQCTVSPALGFQKYAINAQGLVISAYNIEYQRGTRAPLYDTVVTQFSPGSGWASPQTLFSGLTDLGVLLPSSEFVSDISLNENNVAFLSLFQSGPTFSTTEASWRYSPQTGWKEIGSAWPAKAVSGQVQAIGVSAFSNDTALIVGIQSNGTGQPTGLVFNTYR